MTAMSDRLLFIAEIVALIAHRTAISRRDSSAMRLDE